MPSSLSPLGPLSVHSQTAQTPKNYGSETSGRAEVRASMRGKFGEEGGREGWRKQGKVPWRKRGWQCEAPLALGLRVRPCGTSLGFQKRMAAPVFQAFQKWAWFPSGDATDNQLIQLSR